MAMYGDIEILCRVSYRGIDKLISILNILEPYAEDHPLSFVIEANIDLGI